MLKGFGFKGFGFRDTQESKTYWLSVGHKAIQSPYRGESNEKKEMENEMETMVIWGCMGIV